MTMFNLAKAVADLLSPEFAVISVFPVGTHSHEMTLSLELEDEISVTARVGFDTDKDPAALRWLQRKFAREIASLSYLENNAPFIPVPYVIQVDANTDNAVRAPYVVVENPLGEPLVNAIPDLTLPQRETLAIALGESLARLHRLGPLPAKYGSLTGTDSRGVPVVGPLARSWGQSSRAEGPFENIKQYLSTELAHYSRVAQSDPKATPAVQALLAKLGTLLPYLLPNDAAMQRPALSYSDLRDTSIFASEDGSLGGIAGMEATILPACLAATLPVFLRRDGMYNRAYKDPARADRTLLSDTEAQHLRNICIDASRRVDPAFYVALVKGEKIRQMLEFLSTSNWEGLWRWDGDVRRELGLGGR
ncbi:hypothetical protein FRB95_003157 [Tulasnella sp. JGI-2019a]|nr:hypothetical protein FRB95_003157 [Tulasnella sp. JGI-2019a]